MPNQAIAHAFEEDMVSRLARFFPEATRVRIPIKLSRAAGAENENRSSNGQSQNHDDGVNVFFQNTVIEFGTAREVLFAVDHPLEFADRVLVESNDGSLCAEASVVAVQYHTQRTVVAARFLKNVPKMYPIGS